MNIDFPLVDDGYIKGQVQSGFYTNATELVRDAVRRMREADEAKRQRLLRALEIGEADIAAGRTTPYTSELLAQIEADARRHAAEARKPNPDVTP
jgi:antitoxin ParD1/3/4